jgi:hypothetical protein
MDKTLKIILSKPDILQKYPDTVQHILKIPEYQVIGKLLETGDLQAWRSAM